MWAATAVRRLELVQLPRRAVTYCCAVLAVIGLAIPALAGFVPDVSFSADSKKAAVRVNSRPAIIFRVPNGSMSASERAKVTAQRLKPLAENDGWRDLQVKVVGKKRAQIVAGDQLICKATAADAKHAGTSSIALAQRWVESLRTLFAMPPVSISPREIIIPEGESRSAKISGALMSYVTTDENNRSVASSIVNQTRRTLAIKGKSVGRCEIKLDCEGYNTTLVVNVQRYAGKLARTEIAEVTGNPAPRWIMEKAVRQKAPASVRVEPGASVSFGKPSIPTSALRPGTCAKALVPVRVNGPGLIPVTLNAPVSVCNRQVVRRPLDGLFYSNDPEQVKRFGTLFTGHFSTGDRKRLLFHHQNMMKVPMQFTVEIINGGSTSASVHAVSGCTSPIVDTVVVGYLAGRTFIQDYLANVGQIYEIPAMSRLILYTDIVGAKETVSGIIEMQALAGQSVYLRVRAAQPGLTRVANGLIGPIEDESIPSQMSGDVYPSPSQKLTASYSVGDKWAFIRLGKQAISDATQKLKLDGNYGVMYDINVAVNNPTADARDIRVIFEPTAGPASGIFLFGGKIIGAKIVNPPDEFEITRVRLAPGESRQLNIRTIPLAGSAYPATIIVRS
jgi:hypothetical protein